MLAQAAAGCACVRARGLRSEGGSACEYEDRAAAALGSWMSASVAEGPALPPAAPQRPRRRQADLSGPARAADGNAAGPQLRA